MCHTSASTECCYLQRSFSLLQKTLELCTFPTSTSCYSQRRTHLDLIEFPSLELRDYVESMQRRLSAHLAPRQLGHRSSSGRNDDLRILRELAAREREYPSLDDIDEGLRETYLPIASKEAFEAQIDHVESLATRFESIMALYELLDVWNYVRMFLKKITDSGKYPSRKVYLATAAHRSLNARTFLSPDRDVCKQRSENVAPGGRIT